MTVQKSGRPVEVHGLLPHAVRMSMFVILGMMHF